MAKMAKGIIKYLLGFIFVLLLALFLNNRIYVYKYGRLDTTNEVLTDTEIAAVSSAYSFLADNGDAVFPGFKDFSDLILFNDRHEFLICDNTVVAGWDYLGHNGELDKEIHRRNANNPQAFAALVGETWVGSMGTKNRLNRYLVSVVPVLFPPQALLVDDGHYQATIIHEMVHAWQGNNDTLKFGRSRTLHNICKGYYDNERFNALIVQEAGFLKQGILAQNDEDTLAHARGFLETRQMRRRECNMSANEILSERDLEWLEGLARYAEYQASAGSESLVAKNLLNLDQKVKTKGDDRYYTLGMGQALVLDKLQKGWKNEIFDASFSLEECLRKICYSD